jgi:hypothetical protein
VSSHLNGNPQPEPAEPARPGRKWTAGVVALVVVFVALACYDLISGGVASPNRPPASAARTAVEAARAKVAASARSATPVPSPRASVTPSPAPGAVTVGLLTVASATAFGPDGTSDGDHPNLAPGIVNGGDGQAWHSSWYRTPEFGNLQSGTGLLLDLGETVTVSSLRLVLGAPVGADIQAQVGNTPLATEMPVAASASDVGGTVQLGLTTPASGRYVLIWFTQLPLDSPGKYQVSVYSAAVYGTKRTLFAASGIKSSTKLDAIRSYSITMCS